MKEETFKNLVYPREEGSDIMAVISKVSLAESQAEEIVLHHPVQCNKRVLPQECQDKRK